MNKSRAALLLIVLGLTFTAYSRNKAPHTFSDDQCGLCHVDILEAAGRLKPISSAVCIGCHADSAQELAHPVDIYPRRSIPADMPLVADRLSCFTCHFVHPFSAKHRSQGHFLLRRPGKGAIFCSTCHGINEQGHIVFENVHGGTFQVTDRRGSLDDYTLQCIECHDKYITRPIGALGAGNWQHISRTRLNHPVGTHYAKSALKKPREYEPVAALPPEIRLYNGRIGCGTCHNARSKEKFMLVTSNHQSRLCLACHIK